MFIMWNKTSLGSYNSRSLHFWTIKIYVAVDACEKMSGVTAL